MLRSMNNTEVTLRAFPDLTGSNAENFFGETLELHTGLMGLIWGIGINLSIFISLYSYRQYSVYIHGLFGLFACAYSIFTSLPIFLKTGPIVNYTTIPIHISVSVMGVHYLIGLISLLLILGQTGLGLSLRLLILANKSGSLILKIRNWHKICGYAVTLICKSNLYVISSGHSQFWFYFFMDFVFIAMLVMRKRKFPQMIQTVGNKFGNVREVRSILELSEFKELTIFGNYVFELEPIKIFHPAGYQIIQVVANREIDRYMYGIESPESLPEIPAHSHSFKSLTLLGEPIAKIVRPSLYSNFETDEAEVRIASLTKISKTGELYEMRLTMTSRSFNFQRYTDVDQLGRYFSLSFGGIVTRLYTNVAFLQEENLRLIEKCFKSIDKEAQIIILDDVFSNYRDNFSPKFIDSPSINQQNLPQGKDIEMKLLAHSYLFSNQGNSHIPILFKAYPNGNLTQKLLRYSDEKIILSCCKGEGMRFSRIRPGLIILIAGGTGIFPFCDLIDLLFKEAVSESQSSLHSEIMTLSPILNSKPFRKHSFHLMAAFSSLGDIHPITFNQIVYLSKQSKNFKVSLKTKEGNVRIPWGANLTKVQDSFEDILKGEIRERDVSKILICGPPRLTQSLSRLLAQTTTNSELYHFL